jgi:hypothetical protein
VERLKAYLKDDNVSILVHNREEMMVLLKDRHVRHEKTDICFLNGFRFKTDAKFLTKEDVAKLVRTKYIPFYASDIKEIVSHSNHFLIILRDDVTIHFGQFIIQKEQ